jgi:predicted RND superfamily exporter protein
MTILAEGREKGALNDARTMGLIDKFQNYLETQTDARACISIAMMIKLLNRIYHEGNPKWALIPLDPENRSALGGAIKMGGSAGQWMDDTWTNGSIQAMYGDDNHLSIQKRLAKAQKFIQDHPSDKVNFRLFTGFMGSIAAMDHAGNKAYWSCIWGSLALSFIICFLFFRAPGPALAILASTITAQATSWIFMFFQGICISIHSAPAAPLSIGLGSVLGLCLIAGAHKSFPLFPKTPGGRRLAIHCRIRPLVWFGMIPAVMMLPWALIEFKFMAETAALIGFSVFAQIICMATILPFLTDFFKMEGSKLKIH